MLESRWHIFVALVGTAVVSCGGGSGECGDIPDPEPFSLDREVDSAILADSAADRYLDDLDFACTTLCDHILLEERAQDSNTFDACTLVPPPDDGTAGTLTCSGEAGFACY